MMWWALRHLGALCQWPGLQRLGMRDITLDLLRLRLKEAGGQAPCKASPKLWISKVPRALVRLPRCITVSRGSVSCRVDLRTQGGAAMEPEAQRLVDAAVTLFRMSGAPPRCCVFLFVTFSCLVA